jgi:hypothetical protein
MPSPEIGLPVFAIVALGAAAAASTAVSAGEQAAKSAGKQTQIAGSITRFEYRSKDIRQAPSF